ncbi:MAG: AraC family transcriptional regulator [Bacteroidota bacterium]
MPITDSILRKRQLQTLVENQTTYTVGNAEMHLFETFQQAEQVLLQFHEPILASMLEGKKVMHLDRMSSFDFLPGESLILPPDEQMCIDFPEAQLDNPTRCLAMAISEEKIKQTIEFLNTTRPKADEEWSFMDFNFHFSNDLTIKQIIHRLVFLFAEDHPSKEIFVDLMLQELIIRILQTKNQTIYSDQTIQLHNNHRLAHIIHYIRQNLDQNLTIKSLSQKVYMSESNFHRVFKNELNISPIDFINNERLKLASSLLQNPKNKVKDIYMRCGFNSLSYFIRVFKKKEKVTPKEYQNRFKAIL